jgi:hypothetical protein
MNAIVGMVAVTVWVLSGFFTAFLMRMADEANGVRSDVKYWIKDRPDMIKYVIMMGPISLLFGFAAMHDWCNGKK